MTVHIRGFYCSFIWAPKGSVFKLVYLFIKIGEKNSMPHFLTGIIFFRSTLKKHKDNVPLGWSVSGSVIQDHLVCSTWREPTILPWRRIHWFIWLVMTQAISDLHQDHCKGTHPKKYYENEEMIVAVNAIYAIA